MEEGGRKGGREEGWVIIPLLIMNSLILIYVDF